MAPRRAKAKAAPPTRTANCLNFCDHNLHGFDNFPKDVVMHASDEATPLISDCLDMTAVPDGSDGGYPLCRKVTPAPPATASPASSASQAVDPDTERGQWEELRARQTADRIILDKYLMDQMETPGLISTDTVFVITDTELLNHEKRRYFTESTLRMLWERCRFTKDGEQLWSPFCQNRT